MNSIYEDFEKWCIRNNKNNLLHEWDYDNNQKMPNQYTWCSGQKIAWKCSKNHTWKTTIAHRVTDNTGCPVCSNRVILKGYNDLGTLFPNIAKEWNFKKNEGLAPENVTIGSHRKVWWICEKGHEWQAAIYSRKHNGCAVCSGKRLWKGENDLETYCKQNLEKMYLLLEWNYKENIQSPSEVTAHCDKKVYWICNNGHKWSATISSRVDQENNCPRCNSQTSFPEQAIFYYIKQAFPNSVNRYIFDKTELDIFIPDINTGIEYDGFQFHEMRENEDIEKNKKCYDKGIRLIRIREEGLNMFNDCKCIVRQNLDNDITLTKCILELFEFLGEKVKIDIDRDKNKILLQYKIFKENLSVEKAYPELLLDWDKKLNNNLELKNFTRGSHYKATWKCHICGYKWNAEIKSRISGNGCKNCGRKRTTESRSIKVLNIDKQIIYLSITEAEHQTGVERHSISKCCEGIRETAGNYHWKYVL
ncbi:MAG: hypothetical protein IJK18_08675 [Clostridia bacterium]|nr:hypothetical protein [Clostridia bacterium]